MAEVVVEFEEAVQSYSLGLGGILWRAESNSRPAVAQTDLLPVDGDNKEYMNIFCHASLCFCSRSTSSN